MRSQVSQSINLLLRAEGIFKRILKSGACPQVGRSFRNEIAPRAGAAKCEKCREVASVPQTSGLMVLI